MSEFSKGCRSNKIGECRRLADHVATAAQAMGLVASVSQSLVSASHYVLVASSADAEDAIKIRCSDHSDRHGGSDWYAWAGDCPSATIARLAAHFGVAVADGYRPADYVARSEAAAQAAATRSAARRSTEAEMVEAVVAGLAGKKTASKLVAGRVVDGLYPSIPRAQRQRIAAEASRVVTRDRAIAAAGDDENALAALGAKYAEARASLFALVGPLRFGRLRPAGFPRSCWTV